MEFGCKIDEAEAGKVVRLALDCGVNVFDTANVYASGSSEKILGRPRAVRNHVAMTGHAAEPLRTGARASPQPRVSWLSEH
jgi:aryl-alcohol dehydrogenase-like predicted oxidoreductase